MESIKLIIDDETLRRYEKYYFNIHTKASKRPIPHPYHESINIWMIMKRPQMNGLKQKWKDFMVWFIADQGYTNLRIGKCEMTYTVYYPNSRRHDLDNMTPKFMQDGLVLSGFVVDDDSEHITSLTLKCGVDKEHPRTEIKIDIFEYEK